MPRTDVAIVFVKQLLRELVAEIPRRILYAVAGLVAFVLLTIIYFNLLGFLEGRRNNKAINELREGMVQTQQEIEKVRHELEVTRRESEEVRTSISLPETVVSKYGPGVCLIYGSYVFVDPRVGRFVNLKVRQPCLEHDGWHCIGRADAEVGGKERVEGPRRSPCRLYPGDRSWPRRK